MQKIFSARLDEAALDELERATRKTGMTKRQFLEEAIHFRARQLEQEDRKGDVWAETLGSWDRREPPGATIRAARQAFRRAFERRHRGRHARLRG